VSSPLSKNFSLYRLVETSLEPAPSDPPEGRIAIVTDAGSDAMDAGGALTKALRRGRRSRVVLMPRRWHQVGGVFRRRRWQESPITGESAKEAVKTIAQETPGESG